VPSGRRPVTRGVARRNARLAALRDLVSKDWAVLAVDLASQRQAAVLCDHDSVVRGRLSKPRLPISIGITRLGSCLDAT
jgi:hypothetical protein